MDNENNTNSLESQDLDSLFADAVSSEEQPAAEQPADDDGTQARQPEQKPVQDAAENARQAAGRRARERQQIEEKARTAERARTSELLKRLGIERPDGSVISSLDELEEYERQRSDQRLSEGRANEDDIRRIVQETQQQPAQQGSDADIQRELDMIREMDPAMTDLGAILGSDIGPAFREQVNKGATFVQAYARATREKSARAEGERSAGIARAAGKGHLGATSTRGEGALSVPADEMVLFRELNPGVSDREFQAFYNADRKRFGR